MDCRRLFLRDYEVFINIGVHAFEKTKEQRVLINIDLYVPLALSTPKCQARSRKATQICRSGVWGDSMSLCACLNVMTRVP